MLQLVGLDEDGRIALQIWFDVEDIDAAMAELDAAYTRLEERLSRCVGQRLCACGSSGSTMPTTVLPGTRSSSTSRRSFRWRAAGRSLAKTLSIFHSSIGYLRPKRFREMLGAVRYRHEVVAVRGERLALTSLKVGPTDQSPGAPRDELLQLYGLDEEGRIALHVWFDIDDMDAAIAELDAVYARLEGRRPRPSLENAASRADARSTRCSRRRRWDEVAALWADDTSVEDRRRGLRRRRRLRPTRRASRRYRRWPILGSQMMTRYVIAIRGERLALLRCRYSGRDHGPSVSHRGGPHREVDTDGRVIATIAFDLDDIDAAFAELDPGTLPGEAAPHAQTWSVVVSSCSAINRQELPPATSDWSTSTTGEGHHSPRAT